MSLYYIVFFILWNKQHLGSSGISNPVISFIYALTSCQKYLIFGHSHHNWDIVPLWPHPLQHNEISPSDVFSWGSSDHRHFFPITSVWVSLQLGSHAYLKFLIVIKFPLWVYYVFCIFYANSHRDFLVHILWSPGFMLWGDWGHVNKSHYLANGAVDVPVFM